jgi:transposase
MPWLQQNFKDQAIGMLAAGVPQGCVARHFGVSQSTISRLSERHRLTGMTRDRPRPGQPRVTTQVQDMNPIEHVWAMLSRRLQIRVPAPTTDAQLCQALVEEWRQQLDNIVLSMPQRLAALLQSRGGHTRF